jgi:hypothetical protein
LSILVWFGFGLVFQFLRQDLPTYPRLASNSLSSCLCLSSAGIISMCHHVLLFS